MKILVTGASGLLGANVSLEAAKAGHEVVGVSHSKTVRADAFTALRIDLLDGAALRGLVERVRPEWVIHCAALADLEACERDPETARRLNGEVPGVLAETCRKGGARLLHVSTDAVFDGVKGNYVETDDPNPLSVYAETKLAGERAVAAADPNALIARVNLFGFSPSGNRSLAEHFLYNLMDGNPLKGFTDVFFCPLLVNDIAGIFFRMLEMGLGGLYHVFSSECTSKYDFGVRIAGRFGLDAGLIEPISVDDFGLAAARSPNLTIVVHKLSTALGEVPPALSPMIERFWGLYQRGYPQEVEEMVPGA
ncbi:MAG TPA: SDR family oxidoreductase [Anaerolineales bacterium]|nr:SDR family oxidoreductase [Anaerolineales bacterium]